jgi:hypothetical protein
MQKSEPHKSTELLESVSHDERHNIKKIILITVFSVILSITGLGGSISMKDALRENILASDAYSFYQAKVVRQLELKIALKNLEFELAKDLKISNSLKQSISLTIDDYKNTVERYESEPSTNEGKKELLIRAKEHEKERDHALKQDPWFDMAEVLLQMSILLISVSMLTNVGLLFVLGNISGLTGTILSLNGFFLFI